MINFEKRDKIDVVSFTINNINALVTDEIGEAISKIFSNSNSRVIIDLKGIEYVDSSGFGCFLSVMRAARSNYCILKFANPEPKVTELFQTLNLHTVFQIYPDMDSCVKSFN